MIIWLITLEIMCKLKFVIYSPSFVFPCVFFLLLLLRFCYSLSVFFGTKRFDAGPHVDCCRFSGNTIIKVLHTSHSTLDRTCSDSVVSLRCRKSTSDLTNVTDNTSQPLVTTHHKRRGSSKVWFPLLIPIFFFLCFFSFFLTLSPLKRCQKPSTLWLAIVWIEPFLWWDRWCLSVTGWISLFGQPQKLKGFDEKRHIKCINIRRHWSISLSGIRTGTPTKNIQFSWAARYVNDIHSTATFHLCLDLTGHLQTLVKNFFMKIKNQKENFRKFRNVGGCFDLIMFM